MSNSRPWTSWLLSGLTVAIACSLPHSSSAQDTDAIKRELDRFGQLLQEDDDDATERQARYLVDLVDRQLQSKPQLQLNFYTLIGGKFADQEKYEQAEPLFAKAVAVQTAISGRQSAAVAQLLHQQGDAVYYQGRYGESAALYRQALEIRQRLLGQNHLDTAQSWRELAYAFYMDEEYDKAAQCYEQVIDIRQRLLDKNDPLIAGVLREQGNVRYYQRRYEESLELHTRALAICEHNDGPNDLSVAKCLHDRSDSLELLQRPTEAEADLRRALSIHQEQVGFDSSNAAATLRKLGSVLMDLARNDEADQCYKRALAIDERELGELDPTVANSLGAMGQIRMNQGRYAEAEPLYRRALSIRERLDPPRPLEIAKSCNNLGTLYMDMGRYGEAESLQRRALALRQKALPEDDPDVATSLNNVGAVLRSQGRGTEAEPYYRRALAIREARLPQDDPDIASSLHNLANLQCSLGNYEDAEALHLRALKILKKVYGEGHARVAETMSSLADVYWAQEKKAEAQVLYEQTLAILEKQIGASHPELGNALYDLAWCYFYGTEEKRGEALLDRAVDIDRQFPMHPHTAFNIYFLRARVHRYFERNTESIRDLERAMELAERLRGASSGAELERADFFASFSMAFETMLAWQFDDGDFEKALEAIERSRARSLLDEIGLSGADLNAGRPAEEEEQFRQADLELRTQLAELERELQELLASDDPADDELQRLASEVTATREKLYQQFRDARSSSVIYQNLLSRTAKMPSLGEIQRHLLDNQGTMFVYLLGKEDGYLVVLTADNAEFYTLAITEEDAEILGCEPGPLTADLLQQALLAEDGVMRRLASPKPPPELYEQLFVLWHALVPEEVRDDLVAGKWSRLIVVPNGPLAYLPFETLVTSLGETPTFLLDQGPAIFYAPSVTVLDSLRIRAPVQLPADREPVLTVGDPSYQSAPAEDNASRGVLLRGHLAELPFSGLESRWVSESFEKQGIAAVQLVKAGATEAEVRAAVGARRVIHLACHGIVDQAHGNLFGALALAPGEFPDEEPFDDGYLTLGEIYELNLRGCELAILSACETNYGPEQQGEGVWTLSRGFLVAGTRRVVASNWVVDDEAAASLVSYFCGGLAQSDRDGNEHAYGASLLAAKRFIRGQEKWRVPYYWASMVLVGPP